MSKFVNQLLEDSHNEIARLKAELAAVREQRDEAVAACRSTLECLLSSSWRDGGYTIIANDMSIIGAKLRSAISKTEGAKG